MSHPIILRPQAETDIEDAYDWYEEQRPGLGAEFLQAVDSVLDLIARQPEIFPPRSRGARRAPLRRFPYGIIYVTQPDRIDVIACVHAARDPEWWRSRL